MIRDYNIAWRTKRTFIPAADFLGISVDRLASLGAGAAVFQEMVAAAELSGLAIAADGDEIYTFLPIPWDLDRNEPIRFRIWFHHTSTDADTPIWKVFYQFFAKQAALGDAIANTEETITFGAHTCSTTANTLEVTAWKESASQNYIAAADFGMAIAVECDTMSGSANEISLIGLELEYTLGGASEGTRKRTSNAPTTNTGVDS